MDGWSLEYTIDVDTDRALVRAKIFGVWKGHHADSYHQDFEDEAKILFNKPWAKIVDLTAWKTSYPGVVERVAEHMHWCQKHNNVLSVYAVNNPSTFRMLREMITKGGIDHEAQVFRTQGEAEAYISDHWDRAKKKSG